MLTQNNKTRKFRNVVMTTAAVLAIGGAMAKKVSYHLPSRDAAYYFQFTGTHGNESNVALWDQITEAEYEDASCSGGIKGCTLATTSVTGTSTLRPSSVPTNASSTPIVSGSVTEVNTQAN